ncbi:MAG: hypothetical protein MZV70_22185 [Desulfobacterales bacterium]|nr:hypothetical protein [Desulfobacterales bacterium]
MEEEEGARGLVTGLRNPGGRAEGRPSLSLPLCWGYTGFRLTMRSWKQSFYVIWFAELIAIAGFNTTTPIIPLFLRDLGITDPGGLNYWNGLSQSASALALALFAPIWGAWRTGTGASP